MPDFSQWVTKADAARLIGCSTKTVEGLAQSGQLQQASRRNPATGATLAVYHPDDVERVARERNPQPVTPFVLPAEKYSEISQGAAVARPQPQQGEILQALLAAVSAAPQRDSRPSVRISEKVYLTLAEAAELAGLPRRYLRERIRAGELPAIKTGAGWRVRREELLACRF